jgi:TM2 domain-containing membrane protein YozV/DNA-directed RNA polymerase subunit RPC12/RpoP
MSIYVACPSCRKEFSAPDDSAGKVAKCPTCASMIEIPARSARVEAPPVVPTTAPAMPSLACPYCGEKIQASARKCKHCGEYLDESLRPPRTLQREWSPGIAALLSFLIPGAGQIYKGSVVAGLLWFVMTSVGYLLLVVPGLILHLICIIAAASGDPYAGARKAARTYY